MIRRIAPLLVAAAAIAEPAPAPARQAAADAIAKPAFDREALDSYAAGALMTWRVPGLSVSVVRDGQPLLLKGFGIRAAGKADAVDAHTRFSIGSATKGFTAALIAQLADEKKLSWDDRVALHVPELALPPYTPDVTIRDLGAHRSGWGAASYHFMDGATRDGLLARVRHLPQSGQFRAQLTYNNIGYAVLGRIAERAGGASYDELLRSRLFAPLGMADAFTSATDLNRISNLAAPHAEIGGRMQAIEPFDVDSVVAAGGIYASAADMAQWMRMLLANGKIGATRILTEQSVKVMQHMHMPLPVSGIARVWPSTHFYGYGLGWFVRDYRGIKLVEHGGNTAGQSAFVLLAPEIGFGVTVLANADQSDAPTAIAYRALDLALGGAADEVGVRLAPPALEPAAKSVPAASAALPLSAYTGRYTSPLYGDLVVALTGDTLAIDVHPGLQGRLVPLGEHKFDVVWSDPYVQHTGIYRPLAFEPGADGTVARLKIEALSKPTPVFERQP